ncbi:hypothetical protein J6590_049562 [Homalodisca vitripennis]|nr:hypothetical protein J6590_049562 [Homalodisca vitripennis]
MERLDLFQHPQSKLKPNEQKRDPWKITRNTVIDIRIGNNFREEPPVYRTRGEFSSRYFSNRDHKGHWVPSRYFYNNENKGLNPCERPRPEHVVFRSTPTVELLTITTKEGIKTQEKTKRETVERPLPDHVISNDTSLTARASNGRSWTMDRQTDETT